LSPSEIERLLHPLGLTLPVDVAYWFEWHDGVEAADFRRATMGSRFAFGSLA
jgi:hypothetical protein